MTLSAVNQQCKLPVNSKPVPPTASFKLHKWHLNVPEVEFPGNSLSGDTTFAKEQLGAPQEGEGSILGVPWNKRQDTIEAKFPTDHNQVTKRGVLAKIARVYDPLGL